MTLRLIILAVVAVSVANAVVFQKSDDGPEDMHFPVVRGLNNVISRHFDSLYTYLLMKVKYAKLLAVDEKNRNQLDKVIGFRADSLMKLIDYAGSRGINPDIDDPQAADLTQCDMDYGCYKVNRDMEREVYKTLTEAYSSAGSHEDADAQAKLVPMISASLKMISYQKAYIASIDAKLAKMKPKPTTESDNMMDPIDDIFMTNP